MRHVPLERDINIAVNGCSGFATSTQKGPFTAMLISLSGGGYLIEGHHKPTRYWEFRRRCKSPNLVTSLDLSLNRIEALTKCTSVGTSINRE